MAQHSQFSPSAGERWLNCAGSVVLCRRYPDRSSDAADEGTAAHDLAAVTLNRWLLGLEADCYAFEGRLFGVPSNKFEADEGMCEHVQTYVDTIVREAEGGELLVEHSIDLTRVMGAADPGENARSGTADARILRQLDDGSHWLQIHDLKYGQGHKVYAKDNPQLMLYAAGEMLNLEGQGIRISKVTVFIHMPRLGYSSEWDVPLDALDAIAVRARRAVHIVRLIDEGKEAVEANLQPTELGCKWCRAQVDCPSLLRLAEEAAAEEPSVVRAHEDAMLAQRLALVPLIEAWASAAVGEAQRRAFSGRNIPGYKVVRGKPGHRAWDDAEAAERIMVGARLAASQMYSRKLVSPTKAEELAKKKKTQPVPPIGPGVWEKLNAHVVKPEGKLTLVPEIDPRPAVPVTPVADQFENLDEATS